VFYLDLATNEILELTIGATDRPWTCGLRVGSDAEGNIYVCGSALWVLQAQRNGIETDPAPTSEVPVPIWQLY
jgi:hypothetical protein